MNKSSKQSTLAPAVTAHYKDSSKAPALWLRISAFLSLKSANTQRTYSGIIHEWCEFLGAAAGTKESAHLMLKAGDLNAIAFKNWLEQQIGQTPRFSSSGESERGIVIRKKTQTRRDGLQATLANATIRKKFAALRRIYRMLIASNLGISENPFDTDRLPPPPANSGQKRPTEMLDFSKVKEILSLPDTRTPKGLRDKAVLSLLFGGGLRRSEAVTIRIADVRKTTKGTIFVKLRSTKAKRDADQALPKWAASHILALLEVRKREGAKDGDYLFVSYRGKGGTIATPNPLSDSGLYKLFKAYCLKAGAGKFLSPHSARATAITKLLSDGVSHREVQEFSRHSSVQMVEVYDKRRIGVDDNAAKDLDYE